MFIVFLEPEDRVNCFNMPLSFIKNSTKFHKEMYFFLIIDDIFTETGDPVETAITIEEMKIIITSKNVHFCYR